MPLIVTYQVFYSLVISTSIAVVTFVVIKFGRNKKILKSLLVSFLIFLFGFLSCLGGFFYYMFYKNIDDRVFNARSEKNICTWVSENRVVSADVLMKSVMIYNKVIDLGAVDWEINCSNDTIKTEDGDYIGSSVINYYILDSSAFIKFYYTNKNGYTNEANAGFSAINELLCTSFSDFLQKDQLLVRLNIERLTGGVMYGEKINDRIVLLSKDNC